jgi:hypothetical protein
MRLTSSSYEFMHKTEECFRSLHERILDLEQQAWRGPSDEQVERVLRKIIAERFADVGLPPETQIPISRTDVPPAFKESDAFLQSARSLTISRPIAIDPASLIVEPDSVPSRAYAETFQMLETRLAGYPQIALDEPVEDLPSIKPESDYCEQPRQYKT